MGRYLDIARAVAGAGYERNELNEITPTPAAVEAPIPVLNSSNSFYSYPQDKKTWQPQWGCGCQPNTTNGGEFAVCWFCGASRPAQAVQP